MSGDAELCPFSKPILGKWCQCRHAVLTERCSGKMSCKRMDEYHRSCSELDDTIKLNTRFILGVKNNDAVLTHADLMKIRCGSFIGMKRVLALEENQPIDIRNIMTEIINKFGAIEQFPFKEIVQDIKQFKHRG